MATAKICGLTTPDTLAAAVAGGASHVGFVFFAPSPRDLPLAAAPGLAGVAPVFDGAPPGQALPYLLLGDGLQFDWSTKTERGREHRVGLTVWDEGGRIARLGALVAAAEAAVAGLLPLLPHHRIVDVWLVRTRIARPPTGPWAGLVEHRIRTVEL